MDYKHIILLSSFLLYLPQHADSFDGVGFEDVNRLLTDKVTSYKTNIRPRWNQSRPVDVNITMELVSIQGIDEVEERLTLVAVFILVWQDEFMIWDEKDYGGLSEVIVGLKQIWTPNLVLINSMDNFESINKDWNIIRFGYHGYGVHLPGDIFSVSCQVDATFYPWDTQICALTIGAWGYGIHEIQPIATLDAIGVSYFTENGAWDLTTSHVYVDPDSPIVNFILVLTRKPAYVIVNIILPVLFMAVLNILVFFIPTDSGERISYSITVLLAIAVFLTIVGDNLPKTSSPMSILGFFLVLVLAVSVLIIVCTIQSLRLYHRDEAQEIGMVWKCLVKCFKCRCRKRSQRTKSGNSRTKTESKPEIYIHGRQTLENEFEGNGHSEMFHQNIVLRSNTKPCSISHQGRHKPGNVHSEYSESVSEEDDRNDDCTWKDVSHCFDKLAITFFSLMLAASVTLFLLLIFLQKDDQVSDSLG